jgi:hypothetical protein
MAVMKKGVRKKLSKSLARLIKKHGAEMTLALVTGIVSSLAADQQAKADRKAAKAAKAAAAAKPHKRVIPERMSRPAKMERPEPVAAIRRATKAPAQPAIMVRRRMER